VEPREIDSSRAIRDLHQKTKGGAEILAMVSEIKRGIFLRVARIEARKYRGLMEFTVVDEGDSPGCSGVDAVVCIQQTLNRY
jgi:hypothetical protein